MSVAQRSVTQEQRRALRLPVLVIGHPADALHPFTGAESLVRDVQGATLVRARSILELRVRPHRLTKEISAFLDRVYEAGRDHAQVSGVVTSMDRSSHLSG